MKKEDQLEQLYPVLSRVMKDRQMFRFYLWGTLFLILLFAGFAVSVFVFYGR